MTLEDDIAALSIVALFEPLDEEQMRLLAFGSERVTFQKDHLLYSQGEKAEHGFVVVAGEVALTRHIGGQDVVISRAGPGEILGPFALLTETERISGAVATMPTQALKISRFTFLRILSEYPDTAVAIRDTVADELQTFLNRVMQLERSFEQSPDL